MSLNHCVMVACYGCRYFSYFLFLLSHSFATLLPVVFKLVTFNFNCNLFTLIYTLCIRTYTRNKKQIETFLHLLFRPKSHLLCILSFEHNLPIFTLATIHTHTNTHTPNYIPFSYSRLFTQNISHKINEKLFGFFFFFF